MKEYIARKYVICAGAGMIEPGERFDAEFTAEKEKQLLDEGAIECLYSAAMEADMPACEEEEPAHEEDAAEGTEADEAEVPADFDPTAGLISESAEAPKHKTAGKAGRKC